MYNRYIPQPDGTFKRNRIPEPEHAAVQSREARDAAIPIPESTPEQTAAPQPTQRQSAPRMPNRQRKNHSEPHREIPPGNVTSFLKQLLPSNFDTEDLIVVLLLLLMSGNTGEDRNNALLTLAIYLFL